MLRERQQAVREMRGQMWSPGRPSVARREDRQRFWRAIAAGCSSEDAAAAAGVSQAVGSRWFRDGGGMPPISLAPLSGRYLSFAEREEIAILRAQESGCARSRAGWVGPRRRSRGSCAATRRRAAYRSEYRAIDGAVARGAAREPPEGREARHQRRAARVRAGSARRRDRQARRRAGAGPDGALHRSSTRPPSGPALGEVVESGADREPAPGRLPR